MPLLQLVGVDGNFSSFPFGYALMYSETADSFEWVFRQVLAAYGEGVCKAVHMLMGDEDPAQNTAFERVKQVCFFALRFLSNNLPHCLISRQVLLNLPFPSYRGRRFFRMQLCSAARGIWR